MAARPAVVKAPVAARRVTVNVVIENRRGRKKIRLADAQQEIVRVDLGSEVRWVAARGRDDEPRAMEDFWIVFEDGTPFDRHAIDPMEVGVPRRPLKHGWFKYHIVLDSNRVVRLDPVIVVEPPPWP